MAWSLVSARVVLVHATEASCPRRPPGPAAPRTGPTSTHFFTSSGWRAMESVRHSMREAQAARPRRRMRSAIWLSRRWFIRKLSSTNVTCSVVTVASSSITRGADISASCHGRTPTRCRSCSGTGSRGRWPWRCRACRRGRNTPGGAVRQVAPRQGQASRSISSRLMRGARRIGRRPSRWIRLGDGGQVAAALAGRPTRAGSTRLALAQDDGVHLGQVEVLAAAARRDARRRR